MICKTALSYNRSKELLAFLETMRLTEEPVKTDEVASIVEEQNGKEDLASEIDKLNDPSFYPANTPYLMYDENKETIISRTAKGINEGVLNPYEINWMEVTLYEFLFVKPLLELINSAFIMDVAQAIDDEESRCMLEDGQYTTVSSYSYGTGLGMANYYSHTINNLNNDSISAVKIAEVMLDQRNKAEAYRKKIEQQKGKELENTAKVSSLSTERDDGTSSDKQLPLKIKQLQQELDEWKEKYEEILNMEPEQAFKGTKQPCFTKAQMCLLIYTVASIKDGPIPVKKKLVPIITAISGYEETSVDSEIRKGGFRKKDIETVARIFEEAMPNLAAEIRKQVERKPTPKK